MQGRAAELNNIRGSFMKALFVILALGTSLVSFAAPVGSVYRSQLTEFRVDPRLNVGHVSGGALTINYVNKQVTLILEDNVCPRNAICLQGPIVRLQATLPIVSVKKTSCGDIVLAKRDLRMGDGPAEEIRVVDYSNAICEIYVPHVVQVNYNTLGGLTLNGPTPNTSSYFGGESLVRIHNHR